MSDEPSWKLLAIEGGQVACLCCGPRQSQLCLSTIIAVGFGFAGVTCDEETIYQEDGEPWDECWTVADAERMAVASPDHDWRIVINGPLRGSTYQRHGVGQWVLVDKNEGFA